jgi:hypothetical protein
MRASLLIPMLFSATLAAQTAGPPSIAPNELVRRVVKNEIQAGDQDRSHWMYEVVCKIPAPAETKTIVEARNGDVTYLDEINGRPLTQQEKSQEQKRVQKFISDPEAQRKARRASEDDNKQTARLFAMLPDAFLYQYAGAEGDNLKLNFQPNPKFSSHSSEAYVFHKMNGFVVVNPKENRLVEISGRLTNGVRFVGGMLGHLDAGGTFDVRREEVAPGHWEIAELKVNMNGKILFFKTIAVQQDEIHRDFERIPDATTLEQAEGMAEKKAVRTPAG